jgi:hypothetical protein
MTKNRQITTGFNKEVQDGIILENISTGELKSFTKSEARRILATDKSKYRIHMD